MQTIPVTFSTTTYCSTNQSVLQGKYKLCPFAMLCYLTSLCLQNDTWPGQDGHVLGKGGGGCMRPCLGSFLGLFTASDAIVEGFHFIICI